MENYILEFLGTMVLILMGEGVNCATSLNKSKAFGSGWTLVTIGWGLAVCMGALVAGPSGGHLNPAVTIGQAVAGNFDDHFRGWCDVPGYIAGQMLGGFVGACLMWLFYKDHFDCTEDKATKLGIFCTSPAIRNTPINFFCEFVATFILMLLILCINRNWQGAGLVPVTYVIIAIGMSLGATTGYAMNAARDIAPRFAHTILPIKGKGDSDWGYAWIPLIAPIIGSVFGVIVFKAVY